jgi:hypothetical protein
MRSTDARNHFHYRTNPGVSTPSIRAMLLWPLPDQLAMHSDPPQNGTYGALTS